MPTAAAAIARPREPVAGNLTVGGVLRSEWMKFRSVRSTWWLLSGAALLVVGLGVIVVVLELGGGAPKQEPPYQVAQQIEFGALLAQLALAVLGVLMFTGEYGSGTIRISISVVPRRLMLLWAKLSVFSAVVLPLPLGSAVVAFELGDLVWHAHPGLRSVGFGDPQVTRIVVGSGLVVAVTAICGLGIGAIIRSTAGSIATIVGIFFVLPVLASLALPRNAAGLARFLPSNAGNALWGGTIGPRSMTPWSGFALLCGYAVVLVAVAAWRLRRGDA
jgi:ABC-type transport system involved in multi-copper enzyme maturation permease subunit